MKRTIAIVLMLVLTLCTLTACGGESKPTIGIIQFGSHASLNNCYDGIIAGLEEAGLNLEDYNVERLDSNFDASVSQTQANNLVNKNAKVIIAIATPSAVAAANASDGDIPVVYCAVTDPTTMENYENMTGSSDIPNFAKQLEVVTAFMGKKDLKIGVLYSSEESSSPVQVANLKEAAKAYEGMEICDSVVADINTIDTKVNELISRKVDCFVNLLDNTVVGKLETNILPLTNDAKIPVFGSEIEQVKVGCAASASIEYINVGKAAGKAAAEIVNGKSANEIPVATITEPDNYYNSKVCAELGLTVPTTVTATDVAK
ncbi:MAG: ABC transporter substrate-binding protein [Clostridia bacterium]|nr:ABC transporter substrate-binding protein [Clostridia bacterium]